MKDGNSRYKHRNGAGIGGTTWNTAAQIKPLGITGTNMDKKWKRSRKRKCINSPQANMKLETETKARKPEITRYLYAELKQERSRCRHGSRKWWSYNISAELDKKKEMKPELTEMHQADTRCQKLLNLLT